MATNLLTDNSAASAVGNATANAATAAIKANGADSPDQLFTTLLVAQIKNQNPLEPADPSQFVSQLTQLSQMEALQKMAAGNTTNATMLQSLQAINLGAQVGSSVSVQTDRVTVGAEPVQGAFTLASPSTSTSVVLTGPTGATYRVALGNQPAGEVAFTIDPSKLGLPQGTYSLQVETATKESPAIEVAGTLKSVKVTASGPVLNISTIGEVAPTAISRFNGRLAA